MLKDSDGRTASRFRCTARDTMTSTQTAENPAVTGKITIHGPHAFDGMRQAGRLAAETLDFITPFVVPGAKTAELDRLCEM